MDAQLNPAGMAEGTSNERRNDSQATSDALGMRLQIDDTLADRQDRGLGSIVDMEFMEDIPDVIFDGFLADIKNIRNLFIGFAVRD